jgi:hypothetical protein
MLVTSFWSPALSYQGKSKDVRNLKVTTEVHNNTYPHAFQALFMKTGRIV